LTSTIHNEAPERRPQLLQPACANLCSHLAPYMETTETIPEKFHSACVTGKSNFFLPARKPPTDESMLMGNGKRGS